MGIVSLRQQLAYATLLFILLLLLVPHTGHAWDMLFWAEWANYILEHGLGNVYQVPDNTYNPVFHYFLWLFGKVLGTTFKVEYYRQWVKVFPLAFDFLGAFWAASLVQERDRRFGLVLLLLFNLAYLYNTLIWAQIDGIYTCLAFGAVVLAVQQRTAGSVMCYVLALATKTQAIIFLPPLLLLWVPQWWHQPGRMVRAVAAGVVTTVLLLAPFVWWSWENYLPRIIQFNLAVTEVFPTVGVSAFNFWYLLKPGLDLPNLADSTPLGGLNYHQWGLLLFCAASALALLPLLLRALAIMRARLVASADLPSSASAPDDLALVLLGCGLIPLVFAFFNTQMHERYWHAAILFLAAYGFLRRDYWPYVLASAAYFLNLESVVSFLQLQNYNGLLFDQRFIAALFALAIGASFMRLYWLARNKAWQAVIQEKTAQIKV